MKYQSDPVFRTTEGMVLTGTMATYDSQAEASERIPQQWCAFLRDHQAVGGSAKFYGASPCTGDHKIHYMTGVAQESPESTVGGQSLTLEAGEYAVVPVDDPIELRETWSWLLRSWLPNSGRKERNAPEFERFTSISKVGRPVGPVEIWIPLEPLHVRR